jgi:SPP1 gp7 family putative phage head morphogenesis protein
MLLTQDKYFRQILGVVDTVFEENKKELEILVLNTIQTQVTKQMQNIQKNLQQDEIDILTGGMKQAYRRGAVLATQQINRVEPQKQPAKFTGLSQDDLRLLRMLEDTSFDLISTLTSSQIAITKRIFTEGMTNGRSRTQIKKDIMSALGTTEFDTRRIVYTEIVRTTATAARKRYLQSGVVLWKWQTALDERVCPICGSLHGKTVKIGEEWNKFLSKTAKKRNKNNSITQPPAHPFCRCGVIPVVHLPKRKVLKPKKEKKMKPLFQGFNNNDRSVILEGLKNIPVQIKNKVSALNGAEPIVKAKGSIADNKIAQTIIPKEILNEHIGSYGMYVGGNYNNVFVSGWSNKFDWFHEIGHAVYDQYVKSLPKTSKKWEQLHKTALETGKFISQRSSVDIYEHFADIFTAYITIPEYLNTKFPELYNFMEKNIFFEKEQIQTQSIGVKKN